MEAVSPFKEGTELIKEAGGEIAKLCFQCGLCTTACPWNTVRKFFIHRMMREAQFGLVDFEGDEWWLCTTCGTCARRCPRGVEIPDVMAAVRNIMVESGMTPGSLRNVAASLSSLGNPWGEDTSKRADWAEGLDIKTFDKDTNYLYFPCCTAAYDSNVTDVSRATAAVLKKVGTDFGILGPQENCCGESIRRTGSDTLFRQLAGKNIEVFHGSGVKKIIVTSPHCYHTFKNEYPELGGDFEVLHFNQYLAGLLREGKIQFTGELKKKVAYHDPCYLGRHNGVYDEPREILKSIPGVELIELPDYRESSLCCGGGGGRIFMETKKGERFSDLRIAQAIELGADILVTSCPYCILNFKDSVLTVDKGETLEIKDISEIVQTVLYAARLCS